MHPQDQVHPQAEQESIFMTFLLCQVDLELELVVLDCLLEATTKKGRQLFQEKSDRLLKATSEKAVNFVRKKVYPRQNPGYAYG